MSKCTGVEKLNRRRAENPRLVVSRSVFAGALLVSIAISWPTLVQAESWTREIDGWIIGRDDVSCLMAKQYDGPGATTLIISTNDRATGTHLVISNQRWSTVIDRAYEFQFDFDGEEHQLGTIGGETPDKRRGFWSPVTNTFLRALAEAAELKISNGDEALTTISLRGSAAAITIFEACRSAVVPELAGVVFESIGSADPFLTAGSMVRRATPDGQGSWASTIQAAYPTAAMREGIEGRVGVRAAVGANGRVISCSVSNSSGSRILDKAACDGMLQYARYNPARGQDGWPAEDQVSTTIVYQLARKR